METHLTNVFDILYITIGTFGVAIIVLGRDINPLQVVEARIQAVET